MKKQLALLIILAITSVIANGQTQYADSLRKALPGVTSKMERFTIFKEIVVDLLWSGYNVDSASSIGMLQISQELDNDSLKGIAYNYVGNFFYLNKNDYLTALDYFYKGIPFAEHAKDKRTVSSIYFDISSIYFDMDDLQKAREFIQNGGANLPEKTHPLYNAMLIQYQWGMNNYYLKTGMADSAFFFAQAASETSKELKDNTYIKFQNLCNMAAVYAALGNSAIAEKYFAEASSIEESFQNPTPVIYFYENYIKHLYTHKKPQEARNWALRLLSLGTRTGNNTYKLLAVKSLATVYESMNQIDSAYYYSRMQSAIEAGIYSQSNRNKIQAYAFSEQIRKIEDSFKEAAYKNKIKQWIYVACLGMFMIVVFVLLWNNSQKQKANKILQKALNDLKSTQAQLIQSEKMASLGALTAGIAHEIQNPLNFVNNFSEVNKDLLDEMNGALKVGNLEEAKSIAKNVSDNEEKIMVHGKRADAIVKSMLQHSQISSGQKELTDINAMCDEYLRLAYHGLLAKDNSFNASISTKFDTSIGKVHVMPQEIGRVLLNLLNNAFYAVTEKSKTAEAGYRPAVSIATRKTDNKVEISVSDNGNGIPASIREKIFQPFFTTKPTGQGTGLGLSLSYDIVKAHGGELKVETKEGKGTVFMLVLPV